MSVTVLICAAIAIGALAVLTAMKKSGRFFSALFLSALEGIIALFAVNAAGAFTGVTLGVNGMTLASGVIFGVPGIAAHLIVKTITGV